jgi:hypothetical protein
MADVDNSIDRNQPVFVNYSVSDVLTGKQGRHCVDWLKNKGVLLREQPSGAADKTDTESVAEFYEEVIRNEAWIRIVGYPTRDGNLHEVQFKLRCSYAPMQYRWEFGDGDESSVAQPIHVYAKPGSYRVNVTTKGPNDREDRRTLDLEVP